MRLLSALLFTGALIFIGILVFRGDSSEQITLGDNCLSLYSSVAQSAGDDPGKADYETYSGLKKSPLHPEEALQSFQLEEGFRIEIVAHEPMIIDPVAMDIDADGRLWVINMPSYNKMPVRQILENTGERTEERERALREQVPDTPEGNVVVLEDTTGDGNGLLPGVL